MQKTNKSFSKRIKVTKNGKLLRRASGQNHFNSRNTGQEGRDKKKGFAIAKADRASILKNMPFTK